MTDTHCCVDGEPLEELVMCAPVGIPGAAFQAKHDGGVFKFSYCPKCGKVSSIVLQNLTDVKKATQG